MNSIRNLSIDEVNVGESFSFRRSFSEDDLNSFAKLSGDFNPLHLDKDYAFSTKFGERVVYGALLSSLFSQLVGMYLPGKRCLYLKQTSIYKNPVFINDEIEVVGTVKRKSLTTSILEIETLIKRDGNVVVSGEALVQII